MKYINYRIDPKYGEMAEAVPESPEDFALLEHWKKLEEACKELPTKMWKKARQRRIKRLTKLQAKYPKRYTVPKSLMR